MADDPEEVRRLLNSWNAARHGWERFQEGARRAAERMIRDLDDDPDTDVPA